MELVINWAVGYHCFPLHQQLTFQPKSITAACTLLNYTAWWQMHTNSSNLFKATARWCFAETRTASCKSQLRCPTSSATASPVINLTSVNCETLKLYLRNCRPNVNCDTNSSQHLKVSARRWNSWRSRKWNLTCRFVISVSRVRRSAARSSSSQQVDVLSTLPNGSVVLNFKVPNSVDSVGGWNLYPIKVVIAF